MLRIVLATKNQHKIFEMKELLKDLPVEIIPAHEVGFDKDIEEDGLTFADNAIKKAKEVCLAVNLPAIADDSGLCVDVLGGLPGIYSARWAGRGANGQALVNKLLTEMKLAPESKRSAQFVSVVAIVWPDGGEAVFEGRIDGQISKEIFGETVGDMPYDSVFIPKGYDKTFKELGIDVKNEISHRSIALEKLSNYLSKNIN